MEISKELQDYIIDILKKRMHWYDKIIKVCDIYNKEGNIYYVNYITSSSYNEKDPPRFEGDGDLIEIDKAIVRDEKINQLLDSIVEPPDFDVESLIYTEEQREKLESLRTHGSAPRNKFSRNLSNQLNNIKKEYSESFQIGQRVWYKGEPGIITFKHTDNKDNPLTRWTVVVKDIEYRYVDGTLLANRKQQDLSNVPIDPELDKLSTEKLLKMYKRTQKRNKGQGNLSIKRILNEREHIGSKEKKIVIVK